MTEIQKALTSLVNEGLCVIPTKDDKTPKFKYGHIDSPLPILTVFDEYQRTGADSFGLLCGRASGGLIGIDVDTKFKPGFWEEFWEDLNTFYPEIIKKCRIERSKSGGAHILYRVIADIGSCNLAHRPKTDSEILENPKSKDRFQCFLELKGKGMLIHSYPSVGYKRVSGDVGTLSIEEHEQLIILCRTYDSKPEEKPLEFKMSSKSSERYDLKPYEDYNNSDEASAILLNLGWEFLSSVGNKDRYKKPGRKGRVVDAIFDRDTRIYRIFSTKCDFQKLVYRPSSLICEVNFGGSWESATSWFEAKGYGKLRRGIEKQIIFNCSRSKTPLPQNISKDGRAEYEQEIEKIGEQYPFGIFWAEDNTISREDLYKVSFKVGFRLLKYNLVYIEGHIIKKVSKKFYIDKMKSYIKEDVEQHKKLYNNYESFMQSSGDFTMERLEELDLTSILRSTNKISYKFYRNCYVEITENSVSEISYENFDKLIFEEDIRNRDFRKTKLGIGLYHEFISNAIGWSEYVQNCIGFYSHEYKDTNSYMIIASEISDSGKGGGNGKNIFWSLFKEITTYTSVNGATAPKDDSLLQSWDGEKIFILADLPRGYGLEWMKEIINDGAIVKKLFKDKYRVPVEDMCKFGASTNYTYDDSDGGVDRRARMLEFTNFYKDNGGVDSYHGDKRFPKDWDEDEFSYFDNTIISCIQVHLKNKGKIEKNKTSTGSFNKQFDFKYPNLRQFIEDNIERYLGSVNIGNDDLRKGLRDYYDETDTPVKFRVSLGKLSKALTDYCANIGVTVEDCVFRLGSSIRGKKFTKKGYEAPEVSEDLPF